MNRPVRTLVVGLCLAAVTSGLALSQTASPSPDQSAADSRASDKAAAYYNFAMGHLYAELSGAFGNRSDYTNKAIEHYRQAMKLDASAAFSRRADRSLHPGRADQGRGDRGGGPAEARPQQSGRPAALRPDLRAAIGDPQQAKVNEDMLKQAIEQFQKVTAQDPKDIESWLMLGRLERINHNSGSGKGLQGGPRSRRRQRGSADRPGDGVFRGRRHQERDRDVAPGTGKDPNPRTLSALASFYDQTRDFPSAADAWRQALQMDPENSQHQARAGTGCFLHRSSGRGAEVCTTRSPPPIRAICKLNCALRRFTAKRAIFQRRAWRSTRPRNWTRKAWRRGTRKLLLRGRRKKG